jgi:uncharacterized protein (TIGR03083 family)
MDLKREALLLMVSDAGEAGIARPDPALWRTLADVVVAANGAVSRHADWSHAEPAGISPLDAFIETAADFGALLDSLDTEDWRQRTRIEGTVIRDLVQHLVGMERYLLGQLGRGPTHVADRKADHWPVTTEVAADTSDMVNDDVSRAWWQEALRLISACSELGPGHPVRYHHLAGNVRSLLVSRTFELWTHGDDVRQAIGRELDLLDEARLSLMVGELMQAVPIGMALTGQTAPGRSVRFELDGPGGGVFHEPLTLGDQLGAPDVIVSTNTIDLCRLAANRLQVDKLDVVVEGDGTLLAPVLVALAAFAAD